MDKLRVLFLITDFGKGGAERYLIDLCQALIKKEDIEFKIGVLYDNNQYEDETKYFDIVNLHYSTFSFFKKNKNQSYIDLVESFKPHVIHTHRFLAEFLSAMYVKPTIKYICHGHDNMEQFNNFSFNFIFNKKLLIQWLEKQYIFIKKYRKVQPYFIANSKHTFNYYNRVLTQKLRKNVLLVYYGFNFKKFKKENKHGLHYPIRLINVGSFQKKKNQRFLVQVANELKKRNIAFKLSLIGAGEYFNQVQELVKSNELIEFVEMPGIIHNLDRVYSEFDIYVHSATYEPFGLVFLEAMASGLPVITLDGKGNKDIIENGKNGFLITEPNPIIFVDKIEFFLQNPHLYAQMSDYCIQFASKFEMNNHIEEMIQLYKSK